MASFSRLQLAAALIEYDNDPDNPNAPHRSAHDSAIFAHLRRNPRPSMAGSRKSTDYLGVNLPSEGGSGGRDSAMSQGRPRSSIDALRNPFQGDPGDDDEVLEEEVDEQNEGDLEVDLASWGLDSFMPKEKGKQKKKEKVNVLPNPHPNVQAGSHRSHRSMSLGAYDSFGVGGAFLDSASTSKPADARRRSLGDALDSATDVASQRPPLRPRPNSTHALIESLPVTPPLHAVPFPTQSIRSASPIDELMSQDARTHGRAYSSASLGSRGILNDAASSRPMSPGQASDLRMRTTSMGSIDSKALLAEDNPFAIRPPSPSRTSRFDPKAAAHARTQSIASLGSRMLLDNDAGSMMSGRPVSQRPPPRERPLSTLEMLRPKVLIMPSPLQGTVSDPEPLKGREGFQLSTDGRPLPPGARATRSVSGSTLLTDIHPPATALPVASNSFTPNPRSSMTLSQLTFRNQLMVDGQRDVAYTDIDGRLKRATADGEQVDPVEPEEEQPARPVTVIVDEPEQRGRPVGKLFGKSLIDDLEERKAAMRGKARVFTGDERPSMMNRGSMKRSSTLIDPATLNERPSSQHLATFESRPTLARRQSTGATPLLNFNDENTPSPGRLGVSPGLSPGMSKSRSVFGTDVLWEKEMAKLREMEANEEAARKAQAALDALQEGKKKKKKSKGKKGKDNDKSEESPQAQTPESPALPRVSAEPPTLPAIPKGITRGPPPPVLDDDTESESDSDDAAETPALGQKAGEASAEGWFAGASDDEKAGPVRTTGVGPRYPNRARGHSVPAQRRDDDSEEEDLPLAATIPRAVQRATKFGTSLAADDSDEDKPLSVVLDKKLKISDSVRSPSISGSKEATSPAAGNDGDDEDDDKPLGLRASRIPPRASGGDDDDDDDKPLALHPDQQRRTQFMMLQQQQQQQQQMMMQAQMQSSMMFGNPSFMGSGFFAPPMAPPMMMGPMPPPVPVSPPPLMADQGKFVRVDKWRHDVAVEGST